MLQNHFKNVPWIKNVKKTFFYIYLQKHRPHPSVWPKSWWKERCFLYVGSPTPALTTNNMHVYLYYSGSSILPLLHDRQTTVLRPHFRNNLGKAAPERLNQSGFSWSKRWWGCSGINWMTSKYLHLAPRITMPACHYSIFYRLDALPDAQPTMSKY